MPDASHDFGAHLRQAREQRGISLRDIAARTKISVLALEALERNDVSRLPGGIFTRAFVRAYANEVGLDAEDTVRRFLARFPDETTEDAPRHYEPNPDHISVDEPPTLGRAWRAVAWSVPLLLVVAYFGFGGRLPWWGDRVGRTAAAAPVQNPTPAVPSAPAPAPVQPPSAAADKAEGAASSVNNAPPTASQQPDASQQPAGAQSPAGSPPTPAAAPAVAAATGQPVAASDAAGAGAFRLTLVPREASWVSVRVNGERVYSAMMNPGERKELALHGDVSLTVGNAGAFDYFLNGQPAKTLGGVGQVATVRLNADNLKSFVEGR
jgi:cytoskeletal protein RodZ